MNKVAVVTDSNSGITQAQSAALNLHVLPMPVVIDGISYFEDINLTQEEFYKKLEQDCEVSTSQPSPGTVMGLWDNLLTEYDEIVHIPMSKGLSAAYASSMSLSEEYGGRVHVVDNQRISVTQRRSALDALTLANAGWDGLKIKEYLEKVKFQSSIYIMVDNLKHLKKGGRITPAGAALASVLHIKPVLQIHGEKLDAYAKALGVKQARKTLIKAISDDFAGRFAGYSDPEHMWLDMAYTNDLESAQNFKKDVISAFPGYDIHMDPLSLSVSSHIGPGALAVACSRRIDCL